MEKSPIFWKSIKQSLVAIYISDSLCIKKILIIIKKYYLNYLDIIYH